MISPIPEEPAEKRISVEPEITPGSAYNETAGDVNSPSAVESFKLPKSARMPAGGPYQRLFRQRQAVSDDCILINCMPNGLDRHRLGLAVAKKMFRKAVDRNRVKRLIREAFRHESNTFGAGLDLVIRPKVKHLSLPMLRSSIKKLVPKAERRFLPKPEATAEIKPE